MNFEEAGSRIADFLPMENGEVVFLVKTEHMGCKLYMRDEKLSEIQQKSVSVDSQNIMIFGTDTVAILSKSCLTMINICTGLHTREIPLPEDNTLAASNGSKEFVFYTNKSLSFVDCQGKTVRNINIAFEKCYLIHTTTKLVYLFSQNNELSVCTKDGHEIQRHILPEKVCSCTTAPDGGLIAVSNSSSVYHLDADGSIWSLIQSDFEQMTNIHIVSFCHRAKTLLFCHGFDDVSLYVYENCE